jgi:hypothetical protein
MIQEITDLPDNVLGLKALGEVEAEDYQRVLVPALESKLRDHRRVRLLYVIDESFTGYTGGAAWEDAKIGMFHLTAFERVAVVTNEEWILKMVSAFGFAMPGEVRVFAPEELASAREWSCEAPARSDLKFELLTDSATVVLEPHGALEAGDFERLAEAVGDFEKQGGILRGVLIDAGKFPGWGDLTALTSHIELARTHRKELRRIALVSDDRLLAGLPLLASHFVDAEVRSFNASQRDQALVWVGGAASNDS